MTIAVAFLALAYSARSFAVIKSISSGSTAYRAILINVYTSSPNTSFFETSHSLASGSTAYRAEDACIECGSYATSPNTSFFLNISSVASGSVAYRSELSHIAAGAYSSSPNPLFFNVNINCDFFDLTR